MSRFEEVKEVLLRDKEFTIAEINAKKMRAVDLDFFLGMDASDLHDREKGIIEEIARRDDLPIIQKLLAFEAEYIISAVSSEGKMEVVNTLSRVVPLILITRYFGIPIEDKKQMQDWLRKLFDQLFLNLADDPVVAKEAMQASTELKAYLSRVIGQQQHDFEQGKRLGDTLVTRLFKLSKKHGFIDDDFIRRNISGLMIGAVDTTSKCVVLIIQELMKRPEAFANATKLATENNTLLLKNICYEALRFNPHNPIVVRFSQKEESIGSNGRYHIPANSKIAVGIFSAMHDSTVFSDPGKFISDRDNEYLHFGYGLHSCFGRYINAVQIPEIVAAILRLKHVRPSTINKGRVVYNGSFPQEYWLEFDV